MRWLLALVAITVLNGRADARMKILREPALAMACPSSPSWPEVLECLKKHNLAATIVSTLDGAKLISVEDATTKTHVIEAFALYTQKGTSWILGGLLEQSGAADELELVRFERVMGVKSGYRFDVAVTQAMPAVSSVSRTLRATFCGGTTYRCLTITPQCSSIVFGQTVELFDGTTVIHDGKVSLQGVGTQPTCSGQGDYSLNF